MEPLVLAVRIYCQDKETEFGIEKCTMLFMRNGKRQIMKGIELLNPEKIRMLGEKKTYKFLGIFESDTIKVEIKELKKSISGERENYPKPKC